VRHLENFDCCRKKKQKKKKKINILEFGRELGKENWSLGICVAFYHFFFKVPSLIDLIFSLDTKSL
jgi:hypothetical protein